MQQTPDPRPQVIELGRLQLDMLADKASWRGKVTQLGPKAAHILGALILAQGEIVPCDDLIDEIWGKPHPSTRAFVLATLSNHIWLLRQKLGDDVIRTETGNTQGRPVRGYGIDAKVAKHYQRT